MDRNNITSEVIQKLKFMADEEKPVYGSFNKSADTVKRKDKTWSDTNLTRDFIGNEEFLRLKCRNCNGILFEILHTGDYETSARCNNCGMYYIAHSG